MGSKETSRLRWNLKTHFKTVPNINPKPLYIIFISSVMKACFPNEWKKAGVIAVRERGEKQTIKNSRPVSILPICSKFFEQIIFNFLFRYLENNKFLTCHQPGFRPSD